MENENINWSRKYKIKINRMFREVVGLERIPYPEVDSFLERLRSRIVVLFRLEHLIYRKYR